MVDEGVLVVVLRPEGGEELVEPPAEDDGVVGDPDGVVGDPAATVTASFMPLPQWPATPQMK